MNEWGNEKPTNISRGPALFIQLTVVLRYGAFLPMKQVWWPTLLGFLFLISVLSYLTPLPSPAPPDLPHSGPAPPQAWVKKFLLWKPCYNVPVPRLAFLIWEHLFYDIFPLSEFTLLLFLPGQFLTHLCFLFSLRWLVSQRKYPTFLFFSVFLYTFTTSQLGASGCSQEKEAVNSLLADKPQVL